MIARPGQCRETRCSPLNLAETGHVALVAKQLTESTCNDGAILRNEGNADADDRRDLEDRVSASGGRIRSGRPMTEALLCRQIDTRVEPDLTEFEGRRSQQLAGWIK